MILYFSSVVVGAIHFKYFTDLIRSLENHIRAGAQLGAQVDVALIKAAVLKLKKLRMTPATSFMPALILPLLCIILPAISSYFLPVGYSVLVGTGIVAAVTLKPPKKTVNSAKSSPSGSSRSTKTTTPAV